MSHVPHLAKMPPEGADADAWTEATDKLTSQLDALKADCEAGAKDFEAKFTAVHEAFHAIVKLTPKGQEHVEGQEGGEEHDHGSHDHGDSD